MTMQRIIEKMKKYLKNRSKRDILSKFNIYKDEEALKSSDGLLEGNYNDIKSLVSKRDILLRQGKIKELIKYYDNVLELNPKDYIAWNNKGVVLQKLGIELLEKIVFEHASVEDKTFLFKEAMKCFDKAIEINPNSQDALLNKGVTLNALGNLKEAINYFDIALEREPNDSYALFQKGSVLSRLKRYNESIVCYQKSLSSGDENILPFGLLENH